MTVGDSERCKVTAEHRVQASRNKFPAKGNQLFRPADEGLGSEETTPEKYHIISNMDCEVTTVIGHDIYGLN
jgi:hypothetical protein